MKTLSFFVYEKNWDVVEEEQHTCSHSSMWEGGIMSGGNPQLEKMQPERAKMNHVYVSWHKQ